MICTSRNSKGWCFNVVKGNAKLLTLILLSPSDDEYSNALYNININMKCQ